MKKLRVTAAQKKRLADMRGSTGGGRKSVGGVMVIPRMMSVEEWEAQALTSQEKLIADARDSIPVVESPPLAAFEDVSHRYKPDPARR